MPSYRSARTLDEIVRLRQQGRLAEAIAACRDVLGHEPLNAAVWNELAHALRFQGQCVEARTAAERALQLDSQLAAAWFNLGAIHEVEGAASQGIDAYRKALELNPDFAEAWNNLGSALGERGARDEEIAAYRRALAINSRLAMVWCNLGHAHRVQGQWAEALTCYDRALAEAPDDMQTFCDRCVSLQALGRQEEALAGWERVIAIMPADAIAHFSRGNLLLALGRLQEAVGAYDCALAIDPDLSEALNNRANALQDLGRHDAALAGYDRVIALKPDRAEAFYNRGVSLDGLKCHDEALASYEKALAINPAYAEAHNNRGNTLQDLKQYDEALASYDRALALNPGCADAWFNRGNALRALGRYADALASFDKALSIIPDYAVAHYNRSNVLQALDRHDDAIAGYDRALACRPDFAEAIYNRGVSLQERGRREEAIEAFRCVLSIQPEHRYAYGALMHQLQHVCNWHDLDDLVKSHVRHVLESESLVSPFTLLSISGDPALQLRCARRHVSDITKNVEPFPVGARYRHSKIRLAYVSADFHYHATAVLMAELFELHDRSRFELSGISFGPDDGSALRARVGAAFDHFIDVRDQSDLAVAKLLRDYEIDIAVDLKGYTGAGRPNIFARRPAPVQVSYLGYPGTMGASFIDYILADRHVIPPGDQVQYTEKVIYLPDSYQVNDSKRVIAERTPTRAEAGLPPQGFVFCCFNSNYKIMPQTFDIWMRLLGKTAGSVLWLLESNEAATRNLRATALSRGIAPERIVFARRMNLDAHLARYHLADLFLDTLPYNAHTTASDALWTGLPVLTCEGTAFPGRVGASLLSAAGLPELITRSAEDYEALAIRLSSDRELLAGIKAKLVKIRGTCPLFDADRFRRNIETAYTIMWERDQRGEAPVGFAI